MAPPPPPRGRGTAIPIQAPQAAIPAHVQTIGVRRPGVGQGGRKIQIATNNFVCEPPQDIIHHYDGL